MSGFDGIAKTMFSGIESIFGDIVIWNPSDGSPQLSDKVLYNSPDSKETLGDVERFNYAPFNYWFEFYETQFPTLKGLIDSGSTEKVYINNIYLDVQRVASKHDGKTMIAYCDLSPVQSNVRTG